MDQTTEQLTRNIVKIILYSNAILLNTWLLVVLWRDPIKRFRNSPSFIIANLALADIVAAVGGLGSTATIFTCKLMCLDTHKLFACIQTVGLQSSFLFIALLAFDRFFAISHPYRYGTIFGSKLCRGLLCILGWATGSILSPLAHYLDLNEEKGREFVLYQLYVVDITVLAVITAILYPLNYYNYLRKKRFLRTSVHPAQIIEDLRLAQSLNVISMIVAIVLFTSMIPYAVVLGFTLGECIDCLIDENFQKFWVNYQASIAVVLFINPIIYTWRLPLYRKSSVIVAKNLLYTITGKKLFRKSSDSLISRSNNNSSRTGQQRTCSTTGINDVQV